MADFRKKEGRVRVGKPRGRKETHQVALLDTYMHTYTPPLTRRMLDTYMHTNTHH